MSIININTDAARDAWAKHRSKVFIVVSIFLVLYFGGSSIKGAWNFFKEPWTKLEKYPTQYVYSAIERNDTHNLLLCSATFVADDLTVPIGSLHGQVYLPFKVLTDIPQRGENFRLVTTETKGKYKPLMRSGPPTDAERVAPVAKVTKPAPTPAPTPPPKKR